MTGRGALNGPVRPPATRPDSTARRRDDRHMPIIPELGRLAVALGVVVAWGLVFTLWLS